MSANYEGWKKLKEGGFIVVIKFGLNFSVVL